MVVVLWLGLGMPAAASAPGDPLPITFEPYRDQPRAYRSKLGTIRYVRDSSAKGPDRRLVAVTPEGPLTPPDFYRAVGDDTFATRLERRRRRVLGLLGTGLAVWGAALATRVVTTDPDRARRATVVGYGGVGILGLALIPAFRHDFGARIRLSDARDRVRRASGTR